MTKKSDKFTYWEYTEEYYIDDKFSDGRLDGNFPIFMTIIFKTLNQKIYTAGFMKTVPSCTIF